MIYFQIYFIHHLLIDNINRIFPYNVVSEKLNLFTLPSKGNPEKSNVVAFDCLFKKVTIYVHSFKVIIPGCFVTASFLPLMIPCLNYLFIQYSLYRQSHARCYEAFL